MDRKALHQSSSLVTWGALSATFRVVGRDGRVAQVVAEYLVRERATPFGYPDYRVESHERANCASVIGR